MTDYAALYADQPAMADHWWWRPGWHVGTRFYAWHITQADHPAMVDLVNSYRHAIADTPALDRIPDQWLHMTLQGVGHVEDVDAETIQSVSDSVAGRLRHLDPIVGSYHRAHISREALILPPSMPEEFTRLRTEIRRGIADVLGAAPEPGDGFRAHVSIAYSNASLDAALIRGALDDVEAIEEPATTIYTHVSLIRMHRDRRMYEWETVAQVPIGGTP